MHKWAAMLGLCVLFCLARASAAPTTFERAVALVAESQANCGADVDGVPASVTPCTAIEGADSVVCTDEWHSVPTSCHDGLELVDGICIETRSNGIDCSAVDASLPCNVMLLLAQMREAAAHSDTFVIDPVMFCPCKVVLDASPD